jgi:AAA domain
MRIVHASDGRDIAALLERYKNTKVALLIVDPARVYLAGDEDSSDPVDSFFTRVADFAAAKNCAALVLHHLKRNATQNFSEIANWLRGSGVFLDRPRVVLALLRKDGKPSEFGVAARNGIPLHNLSSAEMFTGVRRLRFDEDTKRHLPVGVPNAGEQPAEADDEAAEAVLAAVARLVQEGERVTRTGASSVYDRKPAELDGVSRKRARTAVDALLASGRLDCDAGGSLSVPKQES